MNVIKKKFFILCLSLLYIGCLEINLAGATTEKSADFSKLHKARIKTSKGDVVFVFNEKKAPHTCKRIKTLIQSGFYNGIKFHRVIPGFVAQAGDPLGTGAGGSGTKLRAEFNDEKHRPGTIAMARKGNDINSADSQWYITLGVHPHLDGKYTIFGKVEEGMDVAMQIKQNEKIIKMSLE